MMLSFEENQHAARFHPDQRDRRFIFGSQPVTRNRAFPETTSGKTLIGLTLQASIGLSCRRTAVRMALARELSCPDCARLRQDQRAGSIAAPKRIASTRR